MLHFPVVLYGTDYWGELLDWVRGELLADGMISPDDLELLHVTDDLDEAVALVRRLLRAALRREPGRARQSGRAVALPCSCAICRR